MDLTLYDYLKNKLKIIYLTGRKDETVIRCPFCGDSVNSDYHAHCYVKNEPPYLFFCQRCEASGNGGELLKQLNFYDPEITQKMNQSYKEYMKEMNLKYGGSLNRNNIEYDVYPNQYGELELNKVRYFNRRLSVSITEADIGKFRYILNLRDFLDKNDIDPLKMVTSKNDKEIEYLNENYAMFLAGNSNDIICRYMPDILDGQRIKRYQRLTLFNTPNSSQKFYTIKNDIDISKPSHTLYLTEGIWDILGVYYMNGCKMSDNELYIANNGKGYLNSLKYALKLGITNADINIYSDADVINENIRRFLKNNMLAKYNGITVYRNNMYMQDKEYKDFGNPQDKIILSNPTKLNIM